jgi:hypothetical protein
MEYTITGFSNGSEENENEVVEVAGSSAGDHSVIVQLPYSYALRALKLPYDYAVAKGRTHVDGMLLVAVAKPGLLGWLQRKIIGW